ncbi:MAG: hypothetical protein PHW76_06965 [Alphaproteobacteria bacterium]|nr:hypothetical protein [Alphaproteobacteria bacterium]
MDDKRFGEVHEEKKHGIWASFKKGASKVCERVGPAVERFNELAIEKIGPLEKNRTGSTKWTKQIFTPETEAEVLLGAVLAPAILSAVGIPTFHVGSCMLCAAARGVYNRVKRPTEHNALENFEKGVVAAALLSALPGVDFGQAAMGTIGWLARAHMGCESNCAAAQLKL